MSYRSRWFEYLNYRPLVEQYWRDDPNMVWEAAPEPRLTDKSFRIGWIDETISEEERLQLVAKKEFVTQDWQEPLFDAADCLRLGKDLFVQHGCTTNAAGIDWIRRHFEPKGYRVHAVNFPGDPFPIHIDATFTPLRPGLILNNPNRFAATTVTLILILTLTLPGPSHRHSAVYSRRTVSMPSHW